MIATATYVGLIGGTKIFWIEIYQKQKSWSRNSKFHAILKIFYDFGYKAQSVPWPA